MIEHSPWIGKNFKSGIAGQKFAIVGYSHWLSDDDPDHKNVTVDAIANVVNGKWDIAFFNQIKNYFEFSEHSDFWQHVMFFNFVPFSIGGPERRFDSADKRQIDLARSRFHRLLQDYEPQKVIVFSKKGWSQCPSSIEEEAGGHCRQFGPPFPNYFERAKYKTSKGIVAAYGLRHTQGATLSVMKAAIKYIVEDEMN